MAIIGIDLGTTNSLVCVFKEGYTALIPNSFGKTLTPSAVSVGEDGSIYVGAVAKERLVTHPEATAASFKRYMGTGKVFERRCGAFFGGRSDRGGYQCTGVF